MAEIQRAASKEKLTVGAWARRVLREARAQQPSKSPEEKLKAIREAAKHSFPTADIRQMLDEIERGSQR
jgi:hypothetical protein